MTAQRHHDGVISLAAHDPRRFATYDSVMQKIKEVL
jgi:hypothetical protein